MRNLIQFCTSEGLVKCAVSSIGFNFTNIAPSAKETNFYNVRIGSPLK